MKETMAKPKLSDWLRVRVVQQTRLCLLSPLLLVPAAVLATMLTGWAIFVALTMGLGSLLGLSWRAITIATGCLLGVLFLWQFTKGRKHREEWHFSGKKSGATDVAIRVVTGSPFVAFALDPAAGMMFVRLLAMMLLCGPRFCVLAWDLVQRGRRLQKMNVPGCAAVLSALIKRQSRMSIDELQRELPQANLAETLPQLGDIDGVVFLSTEPLGLTLAPRLQEDFQQWLKNAKSGSSS